MTPTPTDFLADIPAELPADLAFLTLASTLAVQGQRRAADLAAVVTAHLAVDEHSADARLRAAERMREALLQTVLFAGYPCALNALAVFSATLSAQNPEWLQQLRTEPLEPGNSAAMRDEWERRGIANAQLVYAKNYDKLMRNAASLSPDLAQWMVIEGYGRVLGRPLLDFPTRECCIVATLLPLAVPTQLFSHLRGCVNVGVPLGVVDALIAFLAPHSSPFAADLAHRLWADIRPADDPAAGLAP